MEQQQLPDIYADSVTVTGGPYGFTLTFLVTDPPLGDEPPAPPRPVGRVRLGRELAGALREALHHAAGDNSRSSEMPEAERASGG